LLRLAGIGGAYFLTGKIGLLFAPLNSSATALWPPTGIALAAALFYGYRVWPAILAGAFFVNVTITGDVASSAGIALGNTLECLASAYLVNRFAGGLDAFRRARTIFIYALCAAFLTTIIAATIGVASLAAAGFIDDGTAREVWLTWWLGDATGAMVFAPMILMWTGASRTRIAEGRGRERLIVFAAAFVSSAAVFVMPGLREYPLGFLCLPAVAWAVLRLGQRDMITALALVMFVALFALEFGVGPYVLRTRTDSIIMLHAFVLTGALLALPISAVIADRERMLGEAHLARETAEGAARTKDEFLALLSHELRNPLAAITAATGILRQTTDGDQLGKRAVDIVDRQTAHLGRLVDDLLDISRITRGKISLERKTFPVSEIIARAVESARPLFAARGQRFEFVEPPEQVWIEGDPTRLTQVILNLLNNAAKYTPNGGQIKLTLSAESEQAVVRVRDTGIGISAELLPSIFELFTQGDQSLERSEGGLGLGLAVARRLVELNNGTIDAQSDGPWRGAQFTVRLPLVSAGVHERQDGDRVQRVYPGPACKVLVVDDNVDSAEMLAVLLRMKGNDVRVAYDGPSGVTAAIEYQPTVSLIDIGLPGMSGYDVARELRKRCGDSMGLIAVTGYGQDEDRRRSREAGFDEHLTKPVQFEILEKHVAALSAGRGGDGA
jgi:signal transduction histidine kinase/CheY-like chemotaxis protein